ncbi:MAG: hypothetical protein ABSG93_12105 [Solirubrobacteraceae bacterium]
MSALVAEDRALEVVRVLAVALAALVVGFQDRLDLIEQFLADDGVVATFVELAVVDELSDVEGVGQQRIDG